MVIGHDHTRRIPSRCTYFDYLRGRKRHDGSFVSVLHLLPLVPLSNLIVQFRIVDIEEVHRCSACLQQLLLERLTILCNNLALLQIHMFFRVAKGFFILRGDISV